MPVTCPDGSKPRFRFRNLDGGRKQRLTFCGDKVVEVTNFDRKGNRAGTEKVND